MDLCSVKKTFEGMSNKRITEVKTFVERNGGSFKRWPVKNIPTVCNCEIKFYRLGFMDNRKLLDEAAAMVKEANP